MVRTQGVYLITLSTCRLHMSRWTLTSLTQRQIQTHKPSLKDYSLRPFSRRYSSTQGRLVYCGPLFSRRKPETNLLLLLFFLDINLKEFLSLLIVEILKSLTFHQENLR